MLKYQKLLPLVFCLIPCVAGAQTEGVGEAQTEVVLSEMFRRTNIPVEDIKSSIEACDLSQHSLSLCALAMAASAELIFDNLQQEMLIFRPTEYTNFKAKVWTDCENTGQEAAYGRTMLAADVSLCVAAEFRARHRAMLEVRRIDAAPHPPHKWD